MAVLQCASADLWRMYIQMSTVLSRVRAPHTVYTLYAISKQSENIANAIKRVSLLVKA